MRKYYFIFYQCKKTFAGLAFSANQTAIGEERRAHPKTSKMPKKPIVGLDKGKTERYEEEIDRMTGGCYTRARHDTDWDKSKAGH